MGWIIEESGFDIRQGQEISFSAVTSRPALGPTQAPIQWVQGALSPGVNRRESEADHSPSSSVKVKNDGAIPPLPLRLHGLNKVNYRVELSSGP
jgi:hypothetical protein